MGGCKTKQSHQEYNQSYKKSVHDRHLSVDQTQGGKVFGPMEIFWKSRVNQGQNHQ
jgi:hypothetical protein